MDLTEKSKTDLFYSSKKLCRDVPYVLKLH